ncbi:MAG: hypothetical protein ACKOC5_02360 [Chloroflexota bacterium]
MESPISTHLPDPALDAASSYLAQEFERCRSLYQKQSTMLQRFLDVQGRSIADAITRAAPALQFNLPDRLVSAAGADLALPGELRRQSLRAWPAWLKKAALAGLVRQRLDELELHPQPAAAAAASLVRFAAAQYMVHTLLPSGRSVIYLAEDGEEIPSLPAGLDEPPSAITAAGDAIIDDSGETPPPAGEHGALIVPYVEAARRFYLPQWVALGQNDALLVGSVQEAEAHIASMQRYLAVLHAAVSLAPYIVADPEYQQKRYGMLGQLVNQGRALARYETREIARTIRRRANANALNRGLSISLPYFDDQDLKPHLHRFDIIPAGRVMFVPAFVVLACRREEVKVAQDTRLNPSTRKHILEELRLLEKAFDTASSEA